MDAGQRPVAMQVRRVEVVTNPTHFMLALRLFTEGDPTWMNVVAVFYVFVVVTTVIGWLTGVHFRIEFKWFDAWIGAFIDHKNHRLYVCPLPCVVFVWERRKAASS